MNLIKKLNCQFYRIREKTKEVFKIDNNKNNFINDIQLILNKYK